MDKKLETAKNRYKDLLKRLHSMKSVSKEYDRIYYKLCGMEAIFKCLDVDIIELQKEVFNK
jgi:hypothetical protein